MEELAKFGETLKPIRAIKMITAFFEVMAISKKSVNFYITSPS